MLSFQNTLPFENSHTLFCYICILYIIYYLFIYLLNQIVKSNINKQRKELYEKIRNARENGLIPKSEVLN
ncbi:hypothetical protein C923_05318 [Plasmodium falciparum UGT5.1]|uniref:Uncharacterized protein n=1 Tax=Plasmodium falciparum UGT5.1 TaxID=1237627 RepID=W7JH76_PLAFA|nr:hypothetical protein C923_05318 [Plasmodium falciparum UGT5.1]